jgi:hypothetical protein
MYKGVFRQILTFSLLSCFIVTALAQDQDQDQGKGGPEYSFGGDVTPVSKYLWRGQRLTDDWSLQPAMTFGIGGFSFNAWGTMDLTSINEGDSLFIPENPDAPPGDHSGLQGKFSEVDYTFSYAHSFQDVSIDVGTITYTFPERSASLAATTEIYGGISFDAVPLAPSVTVYVDVDETSKGGGNTGLYFLLAAGHSFALTHPVFSGVDLSTWVGFANNGFGEFFYGASESGAHDFNFTVSLPLTLGENWSVTPFVAYSALLGNFRDYQFVDPRKVHLGTAGSPSDSADTVWGGLTLSLAF